MPDYSRESIGRRLKSGIVDRGLTNEQFADMVGVSHYTVNEWCLACGMSFENAYAACEALGWPLDRLACRNVREDAR